MLAKHRYLRVSYHTVIKLANLWKNAKQKNVSKSCQCHGHANTKPSASDAANWIERLIATALRICPPPTFKFIFNINALSYLYSFLATFWRSWYGISLSVYMNKTENIKIKYYCGVSSCHLFFAIPSCCDSFIVFSLLAKQSILLRHVTFSRIIRELNMRVPYRGRTLVGRYYRAAPIFIVYFLSASLPS